MPSDWLEHQSLWLVFWTKKKGHGNYIFKYFGKCEHYLTCHDDAKALVFGGYDVLNGFQNVAM